MEKKAEAEGRGLVTAGISKLTSMAEAVGRLVRPGSTLVMGAALEAAIPFAVGHEIIRRRIRGLTLVGPISDALFDMMVGGRVVDRIIAAWVGNVGTGLGYCFGRAVRDGLIRVTDHSNLSVATALEAGGMGVEFGVIRSLFGADILAGNPDLVRVACPFTDTPHLAVRAIRPDLAVVHVQRADEEGNAQYWGNLGILPEAVRASRQVLVVAEEIVPPETIRSDPNRTLVPSFKTAAVVHEPWGAHPSPLQGHYGHDDDFFVQYARATRDPDSAEKWFGEWVFGVPHRAAYVKKLGPDRIRDLALKTSAPAAPVEYGF